MEGHPIPTRAPRATAAPTRGPHVLPEPRVLRSFKLGDIDIDVLTAILSRKTHEEVLTPLERA